MPDKTYYRAKQFAMLDLKDRLSGPQRLWLEANPSEWMFGLIAYREEVARQDPRLYDPEDKQRLLDLIDTRIDALREETA